MPILEDNPKTRIKEKATSRQRAKARLKSKKTKRKSKPKNEDFFNLGRFTQLLIIISIFVGIVSTGTYYFLHYVAFGFDKNVIEIKRCIDNKGKWDFDKKVCTN